MRLRILAPVVMLAAAATACSSGHAPAQKPEPSPTSTKASVTTTPTASASTPASNLPAGITLAGTHLPPGPFTITPLSCGPYTPAEQTQFGTNAKGGLIYRYTNMSQSVSGAPSLTVDFTTGSTVAGSNVSGGSSDIGPGQNATAAVDAVGQGGQNLAFTGCELMEYAVPPEPTSYAP